MNLSSAELMVEYRAKLKTLRKARKACDPGHNTVSVKTWYHGEEFDLAALLSKASVRAQLAIMLDREIAALTRDIEAHGVNVDE